MLITKPCVVSLTWRLDDAQGQTIDELAEPLEFFFGGDDLLAKVEEALEGQESGFETRLHLEPEHAFGDYDPQLVCFEERSMFPEGIEPGMQFDGLPEGSATVGMPPDAIYTITEVYPSHVVLDGNHPFHAGRGRHPVQHGLLPSPCPGAPEARPAGRPRCLPKYPEVAYSTRERGFGPRVVCGIFGSSSG